MYKYGHNDANFIIAELKGFYLCRMHLSNSSVQTNIIF